MEPLPDIIPEVHRGPLTVKPQHLHGAPAVTPLGSQPDFNPNTDTKVDFMSTFMEGMSIVLRPEVTVVDTEHKMPHIKEFMHGVVVVVTKQHP
jgi:hypothetical protein